jgi:hypothetical protein
MRPPNFDSVFGPLTQQLGYVMETTIATVGSFAAFGAGITRKGEVVHFPAPVDEGEPDVEMRRLAEQLAARKFYLGIIVVTVSSRRRRASRRLASSMTPPGVRRDNDEGRPREKQPESRRFHSDRAPALDDSSAYIILVMENAQIPGTAESRFVRGWRHDVGGSRQDIVRGRLASRHERQGRDQRRTLGRGDLGHQAALDPDRDRTHRSCPDGAYRAAWRQRTSHLPHVRGAAAGVPDRRSVCGGRERV